MSDLKYQKEFTDALRRARKRYKTKRGAFYEISEDPDLVEEA